MQFDIQIREKLYLQCPPTVIYEQIREAVTVRRAPTPDSPEYVNCLLSDTNVFWDTNSFLELPRGFLPALVKGLEAHGHKTNIRDMRWKRIHVNYGLKINLRQYQEDAVSQILDRKEGVIVAPPAAGKTVLMLEAIRRSGQNALIIVDKKNLVDQWASRCKQFLGLPVNIIGGGMDEKAKSPTNITIAMQQTLAIQMSGIFDEDRTYGFVCLDECHHVSADTYLDVFQKFNSLYRVGISATPYRDDGLDMISQLVIGPVIYKIDSETLLANKYLVRPDIVRIKTGFQHDFWSTHRVTKEMICDKPGCKKNGTSHGHRNNYMAVTKALIEDKPRNTMIALDIANNRNYCNLIVSDRLAHLSSLRELAIELGFPAERTHMLTGKETPSERAEVARKAAYGACAIFSTIAKEALDIPRLDRIYLCWPIKREHILEQQIGRIARTHPDKRGAVCYDFVDEGCSVLSNQAWGRFSWYRSKNYNIKEE
jgi:superfamily II DNA or RNA helicase